MTNFVFHDPSGKRARKATLVAGLLISLAAAVVAGFFATLAFAPRMPNLAMKDPRVLSAMNMRLRPHPRGKPAWTRVPRPRRSPVGSTVRPLTVTFYVNWDETSRASLAAHIEQIDVLAPTWFALKGSRGLLADSEDQPADTIIAKATRKPAILPVIQNAYGGNWNGPLADALLLNPAARAALVQNLTTLAKARGYSGYVFDLEDLSPKGLAAYPLLVAETTKALKPLGREVWVTAVFDDDDAPFAKLQAASDTLVLMAYDQHYSTGSPGPAAGQDWFEQNLDRRLSRLDESRTVLALGSYGYDWKLRDKALPGTADIMSFHEATVVAADSGVKVSMDSTSLNPGFAYMDELGRDHVVWFLDAATMFNEIKVSDDYRPRGYALWRLGSEDPGVWSVLPHAYGKASPANLSAIPPTQDVDFDGSGEVMRVVGTPSPGKRTLEFDPDTGLISTEDYDQIPSGYLVQRYGARQGLVALTFDDGPDPKWTPKLLDILKAKHAQATFFDIGENMQTWPELVQREVAEGHTVGSHTYTHPNISETPVSETRFELNLTQRLFEVLTGRSMRLFRPPYLGDADPSTPEEVAPLITAQKLGYLIVGLRIDPDDWKKPDPTLIVQRTLDRLADKDDPEHEHAGQIVLLHDSGGNRSRTVQALPALIDALRAHGYTLVTVAQLAGLTPQQAMPPTSRATLDLALDGLGFGFFRYTNAFLGFLFISAIALGMARLAFLASLALFHRFAPGHSLPPMLDPAAGPSVTVLIPCFNEEKVIASSVARILESTWSKLEVIVLDDGSTDGTAREVQRAFADEPRVKLLSFPNGGKAAALNLGLAATKGEVIVALDADTLFPPETIGRLVRWFADPEVGAVAGNALVGNRLNLITRWQALEYVTAQNLERRALAALGAVTVVPGAVGAWRRSALAALGGYPGETLAEDQDLTIAVQRAGWRVEFDPSARAFTEAPDTLGGLLKQRFRWSFGTLQCIWKHRAGLFDTSHPALGFVALPQIWLFQIVLALAAPLVDLAVIWSVATALTARMFHPVEWSSDNLMQALLYWAAFVLVDLSAGALGMALEKRAPWRDVIWIPIQRFGYRQLMYYVVVKAVFTAVRGPRVGWGKLERRATAAVEAAA